MKKVMSMVVMVLLMVVSAGHAAPLDTRIPSDAMVYIGWQGADALAPHYNQSNLKGVVENTRIKDYIVENWPKVIGSANNPEKAEELADVQQVGKLLWQHPTAFYFGPLVFVDKKPRFRAAVICDAGADAASLEALVKKLLAKDPPPADVNVQISRDGDVIIVTMGETDAANFKLQPKDRVPSNITLNLAYLAATKGMRRDPAVIAYLDLEKLLAAATLANQNSGESPDAQKKFATALEALGLNNVNQFAYAGGFDNKEWVEDAFIGIKGPRVGLLTLMDDQGVSDETLKLVPKNAVGFTAKRGDLPKLMAEIRSVIKKIDPPTLEKFEEGLAGGKEFAGFDIERDLLNSLGDEWIVYRGHKADDMTSHPFVFVQKLRDPATFQKTLVAIEEKITAMGGEKVKVEKLDTGTIIVNGVRLPLVTIAWAVKNGYLVVSNLEGIAPALEHLEKKGPSILENPTYLAVRKSLPDKKANVILYGEPAKLYSDTYQMIMSILPLARLGGGDIPADLVPLPKRIAPFLTAGGSICWSDNEGFHGSTRSAFPGAELLGGQLAPTTIIGPVVVSTPLMWPALGKARESAKRTADMANLRQIGVGCHMYAVENKDQMPEHLGKLVTGNIVAGGRTFVSARSGTKPLEFTPDLLKEAEKDFAAFSKKFDEHCDYIYVGHAGKLSEAPAGAVLAYEKPRPGAEGIGILFFDGHVEFVRFDRLDEAFKATNEFRKKNELPVIDTEALKKAAAAPR